MASEGTRAKHLKQAFQKAISAFVSETGDDWHSCFEDLGISKQDLTKLFSSVARTLHTSCEKEFDVICKECNMIDLLNKLDAMIDENNSENDVQKLKPSDNSPSDVLAAIRMQHKREEADFLRARLHDLQQTAQTIQSEVQDQRAAVEQGYSSLTAASAFMDNLSNTTPIPMDVAC